ncbi:MAG: GNAT family N-acetyltransferase [Chloroherpetonaceae bacterium]|nr:GNAT family N-acetyltransferase [Chthonomonadaceae bacterium]MDW8207669.1 GNAT family N-acetyltransferase [Chloroherpetonaceae bacterium]
MPDMLVPLLKLPPLEPVLDAMRAQDVIIRRAHPFEITPIREFILAEFGTGWADEVTPCYSRQPVSLYIALRSGRVIGFGAYEATCRNFFGPTGVAQAERGRGIGTALLLACLWGLREMGYAYGIIGGAGPTAFYEKTVHAVVIPDSVPGIYAHPIQKD